ncbi:MAG: hypothetical protein KF738_06900 [Burkholderiales bacterium]|nr:hypothetical protein [Burkholderiales bacterium]
MLSLKFTAEAADLIRKALGTTRVAEPVVYLIEVSDAPVPPALGKAIATGADESRIQELAESQSTKDLLSGRRRLVPAIYPKSQFPKKYLVSIDGIPFVVPPNLEKKLDGGTLHTAPRGLELRDASGAIVMPQ